MIYRLHSCREPFDFHRTTFASLEDFHDRNPAVSEFSNAITAHREVCARWPDAVFMPAQVRMGAGSPVLLGILPSIEAPRDPSAPIQLVGWVRAEPQSLMDQKAIKHNQGNPFDRKLWRTPVKHPPGGNLYVKAELRASDLETPHPGNATIWRDGDQLLLHMEVGGGEISIALPANAVGEIVRGGRG